MWLDDKTDEKISYLRHKPLYRRVATHMVWEYEKKNENKHKTDKRLLTFFTIQMYYLIDLLIQG